MSFASSRFRPSPNHLGGYAAVDGDLVVSGSLIVLGGTSVSGTLSNAANVGGGEGVFQTKNGTILNFRSLVGAGAITLLSSSTEITISASIQPALHSTSHESGGSDEIVVSGLLGELADPQKIAVRVNNGTNIGSRPRLNFLSGSGITINATEDIVNDEIDISISTNGSSSGEANTASNVGFGQGVFDQKVGVDLQFRSLSGSGGISVLSGSNNTIIISGTNGTGQGTLTSAENIGTGEGVFATVSSSVLQFRTIVGSGSVSVISGSDTITIFSVPGGGTLFEEYVQNTTSSLFQTAFTLDLPPVDPNDVIMYINGYAYDLNLDYTVSGTLVTWLNSGFTLEQGDDVKFTYSISSSTSAGESNTAANIGPGEGWFANKTGVILNFRTILATGSVSVISGTDYILISGSSVASASGSVVGPSSSTDSAIALWNGTTGQYLKNSNVVVDTSGNINNFQGKFNGVRFYNNSVVDPFAPSPSVGDQYYNTFLDMEMRYDGTRNKWLSVESMKYDFGRAGNTAIGSFYKNDEGTTFTASRGYVMPFNGTIISLTFFRENSALAIFQILNNGVTVVALSSSFSTGSSESINIDFVKGDRISFRNQLADGNTTIGVVGSARMKWRI